MTKRNQSVVAPMPVDNKPEVKVRTVQQIVLDFVRAMEAKKSAKAEADILAARRTLRILQEEWETTDTHSYLTHGDNETTILEFHRSLVNENVEKESVVRKAKLEMELQAFLFGNEHAQWFRSHRGIWRALKFYAPLTGATTLEDGAFKATVNFDHATKTGVSTGRREERMVRNDDTIHLQYPNGGYKSFKDGTALLRHFAIPTGKTEGKNPPSSRVIIKRKLKKGERLQGFRIVDANHILITHDDAANVGDYEYSPVVSDEGPIEGM